MVYNIKKKKGIKYILLLKSIRNLEKEFKVILFPHRFVKYYCIETTLKKLFFDYKD